MKCLILKTRLGGYLELRSLVSTYDNCRAFSNIQQKKTLSGTINCLILLLYTISITGEKKGIVFAKAFKTFNRKWKVVRNQQLTLIVRLELSKT